MSAFNACCRYLTSEEYQKKYQTIDNKRLADALHVMWKQTIMSTKSVEDWHNFEKFYLFMKEHGVTYQMVPYITVMRKSISKPYGPDNTKILYKPGIAVHPNLSHTGVYRLVVKGVPIIVNHWPLFNFAGRC